MIDLRTFARKAVTELLSAPVTRADAEAIAARHLALAVDAALKEAAKIVSAQARNAKATLAGIGRAATVLERTPAPASPRGRRAGIVKAGAAGRRHGAER